MMVGQPMMGAGMARHVNPHCPFCSGTRINHASRTQCNACVCYKCGGSGWNARKNKPCKKMKLSAHGTVGMGYHGGHYKHPKYKHKKFKMFKKFKLKKFF